MKSSIGMLVGPTSSGKTGIALEFCKRFGIQIISADSRQLYKYMDIGTGKVPTISGSACVKGNGYWDVDGVRIWGYDLVLPGDYFSAFDFKEFAIKKIAELENSNQKVLIVGGTGFFISALLGKTQLSRVRPNPVLRSALEEKPTDELLKILSEQDASVLAKIDKQNRVRLIRAIEVASLPSETKSEEAFSERTIKTFGLTTDREKLYARVDSWAEAIWSDALFDEVAFLVTKGWEGTPQMHGIIYKTALSYKKGEIDYGSGLERVKFDLHAYIRRQQTWFKKDTDIKWLDLTSTEESIFFELETAYT